MRYTLAALVLLLSCAPALAGEWVGRARVVDGDTIAIDGQRLRLVAMDAPEIDQTCGDARGREYDCGEAARSFLEATIRDHVVRCDSGPKDRRDRRGRPLVECYVGGVDVGRVMVRAGWALSAFGSAYIAEHNAAARDRVGMWAGTYIDPAEWRRAKRDAGR